MQPTLLMRAALWQERRRHSGSRTPLAILAGLVVAIGLLSTGVAYAFFTSTGSGTGAVAAGTSQGLTLSPATVNSNKLYPGGSGDVIITISNPNPFNVSVTQLSLPVTPATAYSNSGLSTLNSTCNTNGTGGMTPVTWAYSTKTLSGVVIAAKSGGTAGTLTLTLTGGAAMSSSADTSCQGAFFQMANVTSVTAQQTTATAVSSITQ